MPLNLVDMNKIYTILRVIGNEQVIKHLVELGFVSGSKVMVLSKVNGDFVVRVKDSRVAIGKELAKRIIVV